MTLDPILAVHNWDAITQIANATAGLYAAIVWLYFAFQRVQGRKYWLALADFIMVLCGTGVAVAYTLSILAERPTLLGPIGVRTLIVPLLILPTVTHLWWWKKAHSLIRQAEEDVSNGDSR